MLTGDQRAQFERDGYLVIPGFVARANVDTALQLINSWFVRGFDSTKLPTYHAQTFAPEHTTAPAILDLLGAEGVAAAEELVGTSIGSPSAAQIALRFPVPPGEEAVAFGAHLDGVATPENGVPFDGMLHDFTLLAGVLLSDVEEPDAGNLTVWPGTHDAMAAWFADHGPRAPDPSAFFTMNTTLASATSEPVGITGWAGDLVLAHYLLLHAVGVHRQPHIRYAVFYRLTSTLHGTLGDDRFTDVWAGWPAHRT